MMGIDASMNSCNFFTAAIIEASIQVGLLASTPGSGSGMGTLGLGSAAANTVFDTPVAAACCRGTLILGQTTPPRCARWFRRQR